MSYQGWRSEKNGWKELAFCSREELDAFVSYIKNRWGAIKPEEVYGKESRSEWYESPGMWMTIDMNLACLTATLKGCQLAAGFVDLFPIL